MVWSTEMVVLMFLLAATVAYTGLAFRQVIQFKAGARPLSSLSDWPAISVLQPLCGAEPRLYDSLRSFFVQDYSDFHLVFGVRDPLDPAIQIVEQLKREFPERDVTLIVDARIHGPNLKVSNLMNMMAACRHPMIVVADSDVLAPPDALRSLAIKMNAPGVGAVTTLYSGIGTNGLASRLGALYINDWFLPSALVDLSLSGIDGCYGPLTAIRRSILDDIGGFPALVDYLAEDNRLGRMVRSHNHILSLDSNVVPTLVNALRMRDLFAQEIRWSRTVRNCRPKDHFLSVVTFPLPILIGLAAAVHTLLAAVGVAGYVALRMALSLAVSSKIPAAGRVTPLLVPLRECLCFAVWVASFCGSTVVWRGQQYRLSSSGRLEAVQRQDTVMVPSLAGRDNV